MATLVSFAPTLALPFSLLVPYHHTHRRAVVVGQPEGRLVEAQLHTVLCNGFVFGFPESPRCDSEKQAVGTTVPAECVVPALLARNAGKV